MAYRINNWADIREKFNGTIVLGNGASMAISQKFSYKSLFEQVTRSKVLADDIQRLFNFFNTSDFELILRVVWQATNVNKSLGVTDARTREAYLKVRECLIRAVREVHPERDEVLNALPNIYKYLKNFDTIISLNYDLIPYWAITYGLDIEDGHAFKDCFISGNFDPDWRRFRQNIGREKKVTLIFYPHGNLVFCRNRVEEEMKLRSKSAGLLESVLSAWESEEYVPLFVSEGTKEQKVRSIQGSHYLSTVYREALSAPKCSITIYGWAIGEHDIHILSRLYDPLLTRVAVSVYGDDQAYCNRIHHIISQHMRHDIDVVFFDSCSPGCWNNQ